MSTESPSPPEAASADIKSEVDRTFQEYKRISEYADDLMKYAQEKLNSRLLRWKLGMEAYRKPFQTKFTEQVKIYLDGFESSRAISAEQKEQIRKTVHQSIGQLKAEDSIHPSILHMWCYILVIIPSEILILILSGFLWHPLPGG